MELCSCKYMYIYHHITCDAASWVPSYIHVQWNPSNLDTIGPEESVLIREVSLFQALKSTQTWCLGRKKVSSLERCPYFRGVGSTVHVHVLAQQ